MVSLTSDYKQNLNILSLDHGLLYFALCSGVMLGEGSQDWGSRERLTRQQSNISTGIQALLYLNLKII